MLLESKSSSEEENKESKKLNIRSNDIESNVINITEEDIKRGQEFFETLTEEVQDNLLEEISSASANIEIELFRLLSDKFPELNNKGLNFKIEDYTIYFIKLRNMDDFMDAINWMELIGFIKSTEDEDYFILSKKSHCNFIFHFSKQDLFLPHHGNKITMTKDFDFEKSQTNKWVDIINEKYDKNYPYFKFEEITEEFYNHLAKTKEAYI